MLALVVRFETQRVSAQVDEFISYLAFEIFNLEVEMLLSMLPT